MKISHINECVQTITDEDIVRAMKKIPGYLDITPSDFMDIYRSAFKHAVSRIKTAIKASHIMARNVITVPKETSVSDVVKKMASHDISGVIVSDNGRDVTGVISEKDILKQMCDLQNPSFMHVILQCLKTTGCIAVDLNRMTAADLMSSPPITVPETATILDVADTMDRLNINRVPVVDGTDRLVGIIARSDLVQAMC